MNRQRSTKRTVSYAEVDSDVDVGGDEDEEVYVESKKVEAVTKRGRSTLNDEDDDDDDEQVKKPRSTKKRSSSSVDLSREQSLIESDRWQISTGERTRSKSTGQLLLNPTITTVDIVPVTDNDSARVKLVTFNVNGLRALLGEHF
jgi:hypothetical protein